MIPTHYAQWLEQLRANAQERKYEYLISRGVDGKKFFYFDFDWIGKPRFGDPLKKEMQLFWTPTQRLAFPFQTEQEVEEFKADFVSPRKVSILRVIKPAHSMIDLMG